MKSNYSALLLTQAALAAAQLSEPFRLPESSGPTFATVTEPGWSLPRGGQRTSGHGQPGAAKARAKRKIKKKMRKQSRAKK